MSKRKNKKNKLTMSARWQNWKGPLKFWGLAVVSLLATAVVGWHVLVFVFYSDTFKVAEVDIRGMKNLSEIEARKEAEKLLGHNIIFLRSNQLCSGLTDNPWVAGLRIRKRLPRTVEIEIEERQPVFGLYDDQADKIYGLDEAGFVVAPLASWEKKDNSPAWEQVDQVPLIAAGGTENYVNHFLPLVWGLEDLKWQPGTRLEDDRIFKLRQFTAELRSQGPDWFRVVKEIEIDNKGNITLYCGERVAEVRMGHENFQLRVERLLAMWEIMEKQDLQGEYLDFRFDHQGVAFKPMGDSETKLTALRLEQKRS